jgi:hypothetical protein
MFEKGIPVSSTTSMPGKVRAFLAKSRHERWLAIGANVRTLLYRAGLRRTPRKRPDFPALIAGETAAMRPWLLALARFEHERYIKEILSDPLYQDKRRLLPFGFKIYSQNDEDGIIQEIFARIGLGSRTFVEFGVGNGLENNTLKLLLEGWSGLWLEGSRQDVAAIDGKFSDVIRQGRLRARQAFLDRDNINRLIGQSYTGEIDLISIDVDGNDIHLLEALEVVSPRVIVIEYNGKFPPPLSIAQSYDPAYRWKGTDYSGASLAAIGKVADRKGYALVGCNITGVNAFFVRRDLLGDMFHPSCTAENHYQPPRYFLAPTFIAGHPPDWGRYVTV